mgnify:CR=1 FL=1
MKILFKSLLRLIPINLIILFFKKIFYYKLLSTDSRLNLKKLLELDNFIYLLTGKYSIIYGEGIHVKKRLTGYVNFFTENIQKFGGPCIDIGCGDGEVAIKIARLKIKVTGLDISKRKIDYARKNHINKYLDFVNSDILDFKPEGKKFKTIILSNVLEHIQDRIVFLKTIKKKFSAKYFLIRVPVFDRDWRVPLKKELGIDYRLDSTHFIEYTEESLLSELEMSGIKVMNLQKRWGEIWLAGKVL